MKKAILLFAVPLLLCGCATSQNPASAAAEKNVIRNPRKSFAEKTMPGTKRKPVSGTFCGDRDISDDF